MIRSVKRFAGKSKLVVSLYEHGLFLGHLLQKDFANPGKMWLFLRVMPYTMVGYKRLSNVYDLAKRAKEENVRGAFVECGVWKGGVAGVMAYVERGAGSGRMVWLFDSFEGLPEPTAVDGETAKVYSGDKASGKFDSIKRCVGPLEDVQHLLFSVLNLSKEHIRIEKGWFQDTFPKTKHEIGPIAILRLDADWYESTKYILEELYDQVVSGGYIIVDDYGHWVGCKKAVDEFMQKRGIQKQLIPIDYTGVYWKV